jgi:hypothetical protein
MNVLLGDLPEFKLQWHLVEQGGNVWATGGHVQGKVLAGEYKAVVIIIDSNNCVFCRPFYMRFVVSESEHTLTAMTTIITTPVVACVQSLT